MSEARASVDRPAAVDELHAAARTARGVDRRSGARSGRRASRPRADAGTERATEHRDGGREQSLAALWLLRTGREVVASGLLIALRSADTTRGRRNRLSRVARDDETADHDDCSGVRDLVARLGAADHERTSARVPSQVVIQDRRQPLLAAAAQDELRAAESLALVPPRCWKW